MPIMRDDFLSKFNLSADIKNKKLIDGLTKMGSHGSIDYSQQTAVKVVSENSKYHSILRKYLDITVKLKNIKHTTVHFIETVRPPVHSRPRRLHP